MPHKEDFDPEYMRPLFALGYELAVKGYPWAKFPPGYAETYEEQIMKIDNLNKNLFFLIGAKSRGMENRLN